MLLYGDDLTVEAFVRTGHNSNLTAHAHFLPKFELLTDTFYVLTDAGLIVVVCHGELALVRHLLSC